MGEKTFIQKAQERLGRSYTDWPNAEVPVETCLAELVPVMCRVPCDYLFRDDPAANVECSLLVQEYFDLDSMFCTTDVYNFEGEAMGAEIVFKKDHVPDFERSNPLIKSEKDLDKIKFTGLDAGRFPYLMEFVIQWKKYTGVETFPEISGPWTLAGNLYGMENLIMDTIEDPDFVKELLRRIVEDFHTPLYRAVHETFPAFNMMLMGDAYASVPLVTMDIVDEFIRPALERELTSLDLPGITLLDTAFFGISKLPKEQQRRYIDFIVWSNHFLMCLDPDLSDLGFRECRELAEQYKVPLFVGMDAKYVHYATTEQVCERTKEVMLTCREGTTPLTFQYSCLNNYEDVQKMWTICRAARFYGRPDVSWKDTFEAPAYITFEEFLREKKANNPEGYTFNWLEHSAYRGLV